MKLKIVFDTMVEIILIYAQRSWCKSSLNHPIIQSPKQLSKKKCNKNLGHQHSPTFQSSQTVKRSKRFCPDKQNKTLLCGFLR